MKQHFQTLLKGYCQILSTSNASSRALISLRKSLDTMDWLSKYENATELYNDAKRRWPSNRQPPPGKWILASYDDESIIVYQAYNPQIAQYACENHRFTGCPSYNENRMTWIKTNFLWMMYRSNWASNDNQKHILAIWLRRSAFDSYLAQAVHTQHHNSAENEQANLQTKPREGLIRLQWDPDHHPAGAPVNGRRAIQLGLRKSFSIHSN